jgi:hypothetical protein
LAPPHLKVFEKYTTTWSTWERQLVEAEPQEGTSLLHAFRNLKHLAVRFDRSPHVCMRAHSLGLRRKVVEDVIREMLKAEAVRLWDRHLYRQTVHGQGTQGRVSGSEETTRRSWLLRALRLPPSSSIVMTKALEAAARQSLWSYIGGMSSSCPTNHSVTIGWVGGWDRRNGHAPLPLRRRG